MGARCSASTPKNGASGGVEETGDRDDGLGLGPWLLAVRRRLPAVAGGAGPRGKPPVPAMQRGPASGGGGVKPPRVARTATTAAPAPPLAVPSVGVRVTERGKKVDMGTENPFSILAKMGEGGNEDVSRGPPTQSKRARPNNFKGGQASVQPAPSSKGGSGKGHAKSRKLALNLSRSEEVVLGQERSIQEVGSCTDEAGVFMFTASDGGGAGGMEACPYPSSEGRQLSDTQEAVPMLVSAQAIPESGELLRDDRVGESGAQDVPRGSPGLTHDDAVSRLRQAIQGEGDGPQAGRVAVAEGVDEDILLGDEDVARPPHLTSS